MENFQSSHILGDINTQAKLEKFLLAENKLILPIKTIFQHEWKWTTQSSKRLVKTDLFFYYVPLLDSLKQLLAQKDVIECINEAKPFRTNGFIKDFNDGSYLHSHPIFSNTHNLQIILYYDDVEICNPLSSKSKIHKLGMFYWSLGNIKPEFRSSLRSINLLAIVKTQYIRKYGLDAFLTPFVEEIKLLECGIDVVVNNVVTRYRGSLLCFIGDTLAANFVGGFKEGVGLANRPCRNCLGTHDSIKLSFSESDFVLRDMQSHNDHCTDIETPNLTNVARDFWCKHHGINKRSILCSLESFDVTKCILQDVMHVVIEGMIEMECRAFLKYCINSNFFTLALLNENIINFRYGHLSKDKPSLVDQHHLQGAKLRQNAAQLMTLSNVLPLLVFGHVPEDDERLENLIRLNQILNLMLAFEIHIDDVPLLQQMINIHHSCFLHLYPDINPTPKMHFMIHLPSQILRFGPLRHSWCMRYEAFHLRFKILCSVIKNFRNIALSLSTRFQFLRAYELLRTTNSNTSTFLYSGNEIGTGRTIRIGDHQHSVLLMNRLVCNDPELLILLSNSVICNGTSDRKGTSVLLLNSSEDDMPTFGVIVDIVVSNHQIIFVYVNVTVIQYQSALNAYEVTLAGNESGVIHINDISHHHPITMFNVDGRRYVILLNHRRCEFY